MGALHGSYDTGAYPFTDARPLGWRTEVSDWLADIGASIHNVAPFRFGLIEHEATLDGVETGEIREVPEIRWEGYLWPDNGRLVWYPQNQGAPLAITGNRSRR